MGTTIVIEPKIFFEHFRKMSFVNYQNEIQALTPQTAEEALARRACIGDAMITFNIH
jgi:hypothetical protein